MTFLRGCGGAGSSQGEGMVIRGRDRFMLVVRLLRKILHGSRFRRIAGGARRARAEHLVLLKRAEAERALIRLKSDDPDAKPLYFFLDRVEGERMTLVPRSPKVELCNPPL